MARLYCGDSGATGCWVTGLLGLRGCAVTQLRSYAATRLRGYAVRGYAATRLRGCAVLRFTAKLRNRETAKPVTTQKPSNPVTQYPPPVTSTHTHQRSRVPAA